MTEFDESYTKIAGNNPRAEKAAAAHMLERYRGFLPENPDDADYLQVRSPVLKLAEMALLEIKEHGGRIDPVLIGMLSNASKLEEIQHDLSLKQPKYEKDSPSSHAAGANILAELADELMMSGLVSLPVIARKRGMAM